MLDDARYSWRLLRRNPGFAAVSVLTLTLGIGANTAIFSVINAVLLRALPYRDPGRLVMLWEEDPQRGSGLRRVSPADFVDWRERNRVFENLAYSPGWIGSREFRLLGGARAETIPGAYVSSSLFSTLGVQPLLGRAFTAEEDRKERSAVAVLSYSLWQRRFGGDPGAIGRPVTIDSFTRRAYEVVGIMPPKFQFPDRTELWLPAGWMGVGLERRGPPWFEVVARLKPGVAIERAQREMDAIQARIAAQYPAAGVGTRVRVVMLLDQIAGSLRTTLLLLLAAVGLVLLIACGNVANLLLARAAGRQRELAIRSAVGASRLRVIRQLLTESAMLAGLAGILGTLLVFWGIDFLVSMGPKDTARLNEASVDGRVLAFSLLLSALTAVIFGLAPAWQASKPDLSSSLKEGGRGAGDGIRSGRLRSALVVSELALALVLLAGAALMIQGVLRLERVNLGFQPKNVLTAEVDLSGSGYSTTAHAGFNRPQVFTARVLERIANLPGVESVGATGALPLAPGNTASFLVEGQAAGVRELPASVVRAVSPGYFHTLQIPLRQGRAFTGRDTDTTAPVVIVNEALARRHFPNRNPVGKRLDVGYGERLDRDGTVRPEWHEIVGVVGDVKNAGLDTEVRPEIYKPYFQYAWHWAYLVIRTSSDPARVAAALPGEVAALNRDQPVSRIRMLERVAGESLAEPRFRMVLLALFAGLAVMLAAVGAYGVAAYAVSQRRHEIGVRMALGADRQQVLKLVLGRGLVLVATGIGIGVAVAWPATRVLSSLFVGVRASDPATLLAVAVLLGAVGLAAFYVPARRAMRVDPVDALREE